MPEIIRYYCPEAHLLGQTASENDNPPSTCYCEKCEVTYGRYDFREHLVLLPDSKSQNGQVISIGELEALKIPHYICDDDCWYSCPQSGDCCNDQTKNDPCNCSADKHNEKVDILIKRLIDQV